MTDITTHTTSEELSLIYASYDDGTGNVDQAALQAAIAAGDETIAPLDDLIAAYVQLTGTLTPEMMAPESYFPDVEAVSYLWEEDVVDNLTQLGDLHASDTAFNNAITAFLSYGGATPMTSTSTTDPEAAAMAMLSTVSDIEDFLVETTGDASLAGTVDDIDDFLANGIEVEDVDALVDDDAVVDETFNLFNGADLEEVMSMFIAMGNPGIAMLLYAAYELGPQVRELQEAAQEIMSDGADQMEEITDDTYAVDTESPEGQAEMQDLTNQMNQLSQVLQMMQEFISQSQEVVNQAVEMSSNLSRGTSGALERVTSNIS